MIQRSPCSTFVIEHISWFHVNVYACGLRLSPSPSLIWEIKPDDFVDLVSCRLYTTNLKFFCITFVLINSPSKFLIFIIFNNAIKLSSYNKKPQKTKNEIACFGYHLMTLISYLSLNHNVNKSASTFLFLSLWMLTRTFT